MKKKVLHVVEAYGGGIFSFLVDLVNNTQEDYDIVIAYGIRDETPIDFKKYFSNKIKFIEVKNFTRSINFVKDLKALIELRKIVKIEKPDIIHLHSSKAGFLGRFCTSSRNKKVLYNPHGFSFLMQDCSKIKRAIYWLIEKVSTIKKCTIVGCSEGEYKEALKLTKNSICIDNGIDIEKLKNETKNFIERKIDFNNLKICSVGRINYQKNPKQFNNIAEKFQNFKFTWIGDGELKNQLVSSNIEITGWKSRAEVLKILNDNDIFILTSLWEGLPISLLEAMYLKKICIVSNCIGNKDVIKNNYNGFIANNIEDFENIIKNLNENYFTLIEQAKIDVINKYNLKKMSLEYKKLYEN